MFCSIEETETAKQKKTTLDCHEIFQNFSQRTTERQRQKQRQTTVVERVVT
jgi:hypothetical protein